MSFVSYQTDLINPGLDNCNCTKVPGDHTCEVVGVICIGSVRNFVLRLSVRGGEDSI